MLDIINIKQLKLPLTHDQWLLSLHHPTIVEIPGHDTSKWRVVSTLIHGNEPSGFIAAFNFLKNEIVPHTNLAIVVSSVRAARLNPQFSHRFVPGEFDLNRRFGFNDNHDRVTELARHITKYIGSKSPEIVIDLHNTSGNGPAFAVSTYNNASVRKIASLFTNQMVITRLIVGSLMEQAFGCPTVTIECGGARQEKSHHIALEGLTAFATLKDIPPREDIIIEVFQHPTRVLAHRGISLAYGSTHNKDVDITLIRDIESMNTNTTPPGSTVAWLDRNLEDCLYAINDNGDDVISELFEVKNGRVITQHNLKIFMATTRADIALSDCLFYVVAQ